MNYMYDNSKIEKGDIVQALKTSGDDAYKKNNLYIVKSIADKTLNTVMDEGKSPTNGWATLNFRKLKTLPGLEYTKGDKIIYIGRDNKALSTSIRLGKIYTASGNHKARIIWDDRTGYTRWATEFRVLRLVLKDPNNDKRFINNLTTRYLPK